MGGVAQKGVWKESALGQVLKATCVTKKKKKPQAKKTGKKCHRCKDGDIVQKKGKFGEFYACNKYPKCKTIYILKSQLLHAI